VNPLETIADVCTCACDCQTCKNYMAIGGYDATNPACPIHGDES
jgi:hypothetical protein